VDRGLSVRAQPRRLLAGERRELQHRGCIAGRLGMVSETRGVGRADGRRLQRRQRSAVQCEAAVHGDRLLDHSRANSWENATARVRATTMPEPMHSSRQCVQSLASASSNHSSAWLPATAIASSSILAPGLSFAARPSTASRTVAGISSRRQLSDGVARERHKPEPVDRGKRCDLSEHGLQRMPAIQPDLPIGGDHHRRQAVRAPSEQPHDIERRLVRRVDVLEHENRRRALLEHTPNRRGDLVGNGAALDGVRHVAARPRPQHRRRGRADAA
jgi:hypothetical protein